MSHPRIDLSKEQQDAAFSIVEGIKKKGISVQTLGGYAGTGKSVLVSYLLSVLDNFAVCTYTGKAANVLRRKGANASTIHSLIYKPFTEPDGSVSFLLTDDFPFDGIIVDEASMVPQEIDTDLRSFGVPILYVGDHGQLPPVGNDFNLMQSPMYRLEHIHRNAGTIAQFCQWVRLGRTPKSFPIRENRGNKVRFLKKWDITPQLLLQTDQTICAYNKTRIELNTKARQALGYTDDLHVGEKIMCLRNSHKRGVFNGMQGTVQEVFTHKKKHYLEMESNGIYYENLCYDPKQFNQEKVITDYSKDGPLPFDYAYAITAHKCVHPDTLVETSEGLLPISKVKPEGMIATPYGTRPYINMVKYQGSPSLKIGSHQGYSITITQDHKTDVWSDGDFVLKRANQLKIGDRLRLRIGATTEPSEPIALPTEPLVDVRSRKYDLPEFSGDLAEFLGMMVADGTIYHGGFRLVKRHLEFRERFATLVKSLFGVSPKPVEILGTPGYQVNSTLLSSWLGSIDGLLPHQKHIPECVLRSESQIHCRFLRGLFEDGSALLGRDGLLDHIEWSSSMPKMVDVVRVMLLRLGIVSSSTKNLTDEVIYIYGKYANIFRNKIGFISGFKQDRLDRIKMTDRYSKIPVSQEEVRPLRKFKNPLWNIPVYQNAIARGHISRTVAESLADSKLLPGDIRERLNDRLGYHHIFVDTIEPTFCDSMCVEVPDGHRFLQNGFPHGNSQGDEFNDILVIEQVCKMWEHCRWAYTCASRAKESILWVAA